MSGQQAEALSQIHESQAEKERIENEIMASSIKVLSAKIKELATGTDVGIPKRKRLRYFREYELDGAKFQAIYYPQIPESLTEEEKPEEFILVKRSALDLTDEIDYREVLNYGFTLRITNDIQDPDKQNISNIQLFPGNIASIVEKNDMNPKFKSLADEFVHILVHSTTESSRVLPLDEDKDEQKSKKEIKYYPKESFINGLINELSQIPLLA